jgi:hypothetical protein
MIPRDKIITLDFETYWDQSYTLSKLATSEYIRDDRFKAQCVGIKMGTNDVIWIPDKHVEEALRSIDWSSFALLAHHVQFDGFILTDRYGCVPAYYLDTLSMGRGLHSVGMGASLNALAKFYRKGNKLPDILDTTKGVRDWPPEMMEQAGLYCAVDTQLCYDVFECMLPKFCDSELDLIHETCRMFNEPMLVVDMGRAAAALEQEKDNKAAKIEKSKQDPANLRSNQKFAALLQEYGVEPPLKISKTTGEETFAFAKTDEGFLELQTHDDEAVRFMVAARMAVKSTLNETRAERLIKEGTDGRAVPVYLKYYGAHTGRWSAGNKMNLQNLPRGGELRKSLLAPPGYVLCVADSAQIEPRMLGWIAGDTEILDQFKNKEDVYEHMATIIYGIPLEEVTKTQRFVGKVAVLGLGYGMGWKTFMMTIKLGLMGPPMDISAEDAKKVVNAYRAARTATTDYWKTSSEFLKYMLYDMDAEEGVLRINGADNKIYMPNNMYLEYPGLSESGPGNYVYFDYENADIMDRGGIPNPKRGKKMYGGILTENITQALARIVVGEQLLEIARRYRVATTTHDEVVAVVPEQEASEAMEFMLDVMRTPPAWAPDLPLDAEGGFAREYSK